MTWYLKNPPAHISEYVGDSPMFPYSRPADCPGSDCNHFRPACGLTVCVIAAKLCGEW